VDGRRVTVRAGSDRAVLPVVAVEPFLTQIEWRSTTAWISSGEVQIETPGKFRVCWGREGADGGDETEFFLETANVTFEEPLNFEANLSLTTTVPDATAPVVLTLEPLPALAGTAAMVAPTEVRLRVRDTSLLSWYDALSRDVLDGALAETSFTMCGRLFLELWAEDGHFPVPKCTISATYTTPLLGAAPMRDIILHYPAGYGLKAGIRYGLVFYARMNHANTDDVLLDFDVLCPAEGCAPLPPYATAAHAELAPDINVEAVTGGTEMPTIDDAEIYTKSIPRAGNVDVKVLMSGQNYKRGYVVRLWLMPLSIWDISGVECGTCINMTTFAAAEPFADSAVYFKLKRAKEDQTIGLRIPELPLEGWEATPWLLQVTDTDDLYPAVQLIGLDQRTVPARLSSSIVAAGNDRDIVDRTLPWR
jgi:hypothetical protein